jgi:hypothetical protein
VLANNYPPWDSLELCSAGNCVVNVLFYFSLVILCGSALLYLGEGNSFECEWSETNRVLSVHRVWRIFLLDKSSGHFADLLISGRLKFLEGCSSYLGGKWQGEEVFTTVWIVFS